MLENYTSYAANCSTNATNTSRLQCGQSSSSGDNFSPSFQIVCGILLVGMMLTAVFGNAVVCYIVYQKPAMRSAINLLLCNLAFVDVLIALLCMTCAFVTVIAEDWILGEVFCEVNAFLFSFLVSESTYVLLAISWDRYLIIVRREETLTPYKAKLVICFTWLGSLALSFPPTAVIWGQYTYVTGQIQCTLDDNSLSYSIVFHTLTIAAPMIVMGYVYFKILCTVRRNSTKIINHPPMTNVETRVHRRRKMNINYGFKTRAFLTIFILFIVYFFCFLPYLVSRVDVVLGRHLSTTPFAEVILILLCYLNSMINPLVYYFRISKFREACRDIVPSCCGFSFMLCLPKRPLRRICPHVIYEISSSNEKSVSLNFSSMGAFDLYKQPANT